MRPHATHPDAPHAALASLVSVAAEDGNPYVRYASLAAAQASKDFISTPLCFPATFSAEECTEILSLAMGQAPVIAGLSQPIEDYRTGLTRSLGFNADSRWIYRKLDSLFACINQWYRFDIDGIGESLLYCEYPESTHFHWHVDVGAAPTGTRKLSLSLQLSEADAYAGGGLEFAMLDEMKDARGLGTVIAFPSFLFHRVTTVTAGARRSLVAWAHGPVFR